MRVVLRAPATEDREEFMAAMRTSERFHHPWMTGVSKPEQFDRLIERARDERFDPNFVCRVRDGAIVGFFSLGEIVRGLFQSAYLGYGAVAAHAGRGYMTEGMQLLLERAFTELGLHRIEANIQPANERSIALARRSGFVREGFSEAYLKIDGEWRDHERWALRADQWQATRGEHDRSAIEGEGELLPGAQLGGDR